MDTSTAFRFIPSEKSEIKIETVVVHFGSRAKLVETEILRSA
jgi:hypothetical protein